MSFELKYGRNATLCLDVSNEVLLTDGSTPRGTPLSDPAAAVAAALDEPLDFPPLAKAIVPGDRVALAVEQGVPQVAGIVAGVVHTLVGAGVQASDIHIVLGPDCDQDLPARAVSQLPADTRDQVQMSIHDPSDTSLLSYLAASSEGKPVYINRTICDADVVVPVCTSRLEASLGYVGVHGGLFPMFSDEETRQRFRAPSSNEMSTHLRRRRAETDEAAWLLGVQLTLQITPGPGDSVLHVLAGESHAVAERARSMCEQAWLHRAPERASLVVASIEGGPDQQTWENFGRALFAATRAVRDGGAIVLCTDLCRPPGPALQRLSGPHGEDEEVVRELWRERGDDAVSATLLAETMKRVRVYLLSGLDGELVEDLGVGHVTQAEEIRRLSRQHSSCILLGNAHLAMLTTEQD